MMEARYMKEALFDEAWPLDLSSPHLRSWWIGVRPPARPRPGATPRPGSPSMPHAPPQPSWSAFRCTRPERSEPMDRDFFQLDWQP